jgi:hypothetical protein
MKLFSALTAAIVLAVSVPAKADELSTYDHVVIMFAAGYCLASEGMLSVEEAGEFILKTLKRRNDIEPYQIGNLTKLSTFYDDVTNVKNKLGCQKLSRDFKKILR